MLTHRSLLIFTVKTLAAMDSAVSPFPHGDKAANKILK